MSIGEELAEARHRRGFTVAEVSHYTRIREPIIRSIERDDFLLSGSDSHARGDIRAIAVALGVDPDPLIRQFDETYQPAPELTGAYHRAPQLTETDERSTIPFGPRDQGRVDRWRAARRRIKWIPALVVLILAGLGFAAYHFLFAPTAGNAPPSGQVTPAGSARSATSVPHALIPVSVAAFGPDGKADGDNPQLASLAIDASPATAWTSDAYGTSRFSSAQPGTGLLLDMGREVTITGAGITLGAAPGAAPGAGFQMRVGNTPSLADLSMVAVARNASGALGVRFTAPVRARYVLIWFTTLPPDTSGTFHVSVYSISVQGSSR